MCGELLTNVLALFWMGLVPQGLSLFRIGVLEKEGRGLLFY
jgi:hypothetical protein